MNFAAMPETRRLRRHLPMPIMLRSGHSAREVAEHEAAHVVTILATGGDALYVRTGNLAEFGRPNELDGMTICVVAAASLGTMALAGMIWDCAPHIGPLDAQMVLRWLQSHVGPRPRMHADKVRRLIRGAKSEAAQILVDNHSAVLAVADYIETKGTVFDGRTLRRVASKHMRLPPMTITPMASTWWLAINLDKRATRVIHEIGLGPALCIAQEEMSKKAFGRGAG